MLGLLPLVANCIILLVYFFLSRPHPIFDFSATSVIAIAFYLLYSSLHFVAFSVHETTRQVVRISLLKKHGTAYDDGLVPHFQTKLTPNWTVPIAPIYLFSNVASFYLLLFNFGWGAAIAAHVVAQIALTLLPTPYYVFMPSVKKQLSKLSPIVAVMAATEGFDAVLLADVIDEALRTKRNLGDWWAKLLWEKQSENVARAEEART